MSANGATIAVWTDTHAYASRDDGHSFEPLVTDAHHIVSAVVGDDGTVYLLDDPQSLGVARPGAPIHWRDLAVPFHLVDLALADSHDRLIAFGYSHARCWESVARSDDDGVTWRVVAPPPEPAAGCREGVFSGLVVDGDIYLGTASGPPSRWVRNRGNGWEDLPYDPIFAGPVMGSVARDGWLYASSDGRTDWQHQGPSCGEGNRFCALDPSGVAHALRGVDASPFQVTVVRDGRAAFLLAGYPDSGEHLFALRGDDAVPVALPPTGPIGGFDGVEAALRLDARGRLIAIAGGRIVRRARAGEWQTLDVP